MFITLSIILIDKKKIIIWNKIKEKQKRKIENENKIYIIIAQLFLEEKEENKKLVITNKRFYLISKSWFILIIYLKRACFIFLVIFYAKIKNHSKIKDFNEAKEKKKNEKFSCQFAQK